ncbi:cadherin repeat domain-containing protein [Catenovulum adriaticum]|uniref:Cadherin repeat domain-containing protein n=1 Tax=Catenovulum adriaticum TaxID=2984846 RepID=A0ABY7APQ6_9ALTE|nr:cadherin repeat domain-containing protein [Catenovulum sp. TS8]WAJ71548.1 cadherin repeat domain-containing protein [Catenovulum sp. TS8]
MTRAIFKTSLIASALFLAACSSDNNSNNNDEIKAPISGVAIQTVNSDYTSGQEVVVLDSQSFEITTDGIGKTLVKTDYSIKTYQDDIYHIGKFGIDTIEKFTAENLQNSAYSFSTQQAGEEASGNPYDIVFVNEEKAFVIRYGSDKVLIINPSATQDSEFIIGSIDLSAYNTEKGEPTAADGLIHDDKLYVIMQRLDAAWAPETAYVAIFDVQTGEEIETNANSEDTLKGIPLNGTNPQQDSLTVYGENLYVTTHAPYSATDISASKIEKISLNNYALTEVLNATDIEGNTTGLINESVIVNDEQGYFYVSGGWPAVSSLYQFNPSTGEITQADIAATAINNEGIADIALDTENRLWISVSNAATPGVDVYSVEDNSLLENRITTDLPPTRVEFLF